MHTPLRSRFFCFNIQNFPNVTTSKSTPPYEVHVPPTGNPGSATAQVCITLLHRCVSLFYTGVYHSSAQVCITLLHRCVSLSSAISVFNGLIGDCQAIESDQIISIICHVIQTCYIIK